MKKIILLFTALIFLTACQSDSVFKEQSPNDASTFKTTYENRHNVTINANNKIVYITETEALSLLEDTGILFIGNPNDTTSANLATALIDITNTINTNVYYYELTSNPSNLKAKLNEISEIKSSASLETPIVLFIKKGKITSYIYGPKDTNVINNNQDNLKNTILNNYKTIK